MVDQKQAVQPTLRNFAYEAIRNTIAQMDFYSTPDAIRLDERELAEQLGVSRTPIREALCVLAREGLVQSVARSGFFVMKKSRDEIVEMICAWASLESMAARLATERATDEELSSLKGLFEDADNADEGADEVYSDANFRFHQEILRLGGNTIIDGLTSGLLVHMKAIRRAALKQELRAERSRSEHSEIIHALKARDADLAGVLVRNHALGLATHVREHGLSRG
ncbi:GntR family transcriptional regulator [Hartmannibacter diazotrophicus]|nr:GntR family transcriptional regulator [Hartmannibacter diazotrophicus]